MVEKTEQHINDFYYTWDMLNVSIDLLIQKIKQSNIKFKNIYAIPRGGLILGVCLSHKLNIPLVKDTIMPYTLIVDDICDTGKTLVPFTDLTRVALVVKPKGLNIVPELLYDIKVKNNTWVHFPWE